MTHICSLIGVQTRLSKTPSVPSSMAIPGDSHVLHPGITTTSASMQLMTSGVSPLLLTPSVNTKIHRVPTQSTGASPLSLTPSVNTKIHRVPTHSTSASPLSLTPSISTKIHCVPPHSNLHNHRLSTLSMTLERPNTEATFSMPLNNEPLPPSAANVLRASGIAKLLKTYPNQRFVDTLTSIAISGA